MAKKGRLKERKIERKERFKEGKILGNKYKGRVLEHSDCLQMYKGEEYWNIVMEEPKRKWLKNVQRREDS